MRLGRNKIVEAFGNTSLLEKVIFSLQPLESEILVVIAQDSALPSLGSFPKLRVVRDIFPGKGSLGGIYTGLINATAVKNLVIAGDMPFLNLDLLRYMWQISEGFDMVVPSLEGNLEPLHAIYSRNCIAPIERLIKQNDLRIFDFYAEVKVRYVERTEIDRYDPEHVSFFNINTEEELRAGLELLKKKDSSDKR
jgi:molybdopterin-guanine dinucleotide biosynthesis protein A